ncbi:MAG: type II secretion system major pseudopilin GspG [Candidatus Omnitrophica bacterium]|nr:type II secretion system major pseudopilin GspG [Candidatus Omnitrophota bacterium]
MQGFWHGRSGWTLRTTRTRRSLAGFTLIEIMLVVIILGVLAAMVVPRLSGRSEEARKSIAKTDIESNIPLALDLYEVDTGSFPETLDDLREEPADAQNWKGPYLKKKPVDPWGRAYVYQSPGEHNTGSFDLYSLGKDGVEGGDDDIVNWDE